MNLLFICGFPSSGTDLLRNILNAHPDIFIGGEFPLLPHLSENFGATIAPNRIGAAQIAIRRCDIYNNLANAGVKFVPESSLLFSDLFIRMLTTEKALWYGNKTPQNTENIDKLVSLFPNAKYIIIVRDIRDVAISWQRKWGKDIYLCAQKWNQRMSMGIGSTNKLPTTQYLYLSYESLLENLEAESRTICEFLGINFDSRIIEFHKYVRDIVPGKLNFGREIVVDNSNKWINSLTDRQIRRVEQIAWPMMLHFSYQPTLATEHFPLTILERIRAILRDIFAILFIGNRALTGNHLSDRVSTFTNLMRKFRLRR